MQLGGLTTKGGSEAQDTRVSLVVIDSGSLTGVTQTSCRDQKSFSVS